MSKCCVCGREFPEENLVSCSQCGKVYCEGCADEDPSMVALGICSDCEETWQAEDDMDDDM